jgi:hypothetical protein
MKQNQTLNNIVAIVKSTWKLLLQAVSFAEIENAKMTIEMVAKQATYVGEQDGWLSEFEPPEIFLRKERGRLVWEATFYYKNSQGLTIYKGRHAKVEIDDETSQIITVNLIKR